MYVREKVSRNTIQLVNLECLNYTFLALLHWILVWLPWITTFLNISWYNSYLSPVHISCPNNFKLVTYKWKSELKHDRQTGGFWFFMLSSMFFFDVSCLTCRHLNFEGQASNVWKTSVIVDLHLQYPNWKSFGQEMWSTQNTFKPLVRHLLHQNILIIKDFIKKRS